MSVSTSGEGRFMRRDAAKALFILVALLLASMPGLVELPSASRIKDLLLSSLVPPPPTTQIGRIKTVSGIASITRGSQHLQAAAGVPVYQGDVIETAADGSVGITLIDDSVFSAGPNSQLALPEFRFDVGNSHGDMLAELKKGTLAVVSGEITHTTPGAMSVKTPTAILGVRGTTFAVEVAVVGLCQCGGDQSTAARRCLPSAHSCQAACGWAPYSFVAASRSEVAACGPEASYPEERYVVLPNADGRPGAGAITVNHAGTATTLDQPYAAAELRDGAEASVAMDAASTQAVFQHALAARPALPSHYRLNFQLDSDQMTPDSAASLAAVVADIKKRQVYEVELVGHTDTLADEAHNTKLSRERAMAVDRALVRDGVDAKAILIIARGESEPLIPTAHGVAEPRNRRVEISIR
jgi:outer membrane protein OmpA-like peptidoglycan-associated protein